MKFKCRKIGIDDFLDNFFTGKTRGRKRIARGAHRWFAWRPVKVGEDCRWLEFVARTYERLYLYANDYNTMTVYAPIETLGEPK